MKKGLGIILFIVFALQFAGVKGQISIGDDLSTIDYSKPQEYEIAGVTISGVKYLDNNVLVMLSGLMLVIKLQFPEIRCQMRLKNYGSRAYSKTS